MTNKERIELLEVENEVLKKQIENLEKTISTLNSDTDRLTQELQTEKTKHPFLRRR